jgi:type II restriction enzyme
MALTGNKGEWSEIYALFKLLGDEKIYAGDEFLNKIEDIFYPIVAILRSDSWSNKQYRYGINSNSHVVIISSDGFELLRLPTKKFTEMADVLLQKINDNTQGAGAFALPEIESFMHSISCESIKAASHDKTDIRIVMHDLRTGMSPLLGFSIKSQLGSPSTLINASGATKFSYKIVGGVITDDDIERINTISTKSKIRDRIAEILKLGAEFKFDNIPHDNFRNNLILIDSCMPRLMGALLLRYFSTGISSIRELVTSLNESNPLKYELDNNANFYIFKVRNLLTDAALGMMPATAWSGRYEANGGYIVVKEDGDVLCYHFYNRNTFEDYLYNNTKLDTPSSTRHDFGTIKRDSDGNLAFDLSLQIRFNE